MDSVAKLEKKAMENNLPEDLTAEILWKLPEDLIAEILSRLPVKVLLRFKCVCKSWYDLITSPNFINMNLRKSHDSLIAIRDLEDKSIVLSFHSYESLTTISSFDLEVPNVIFGLCDVVGTCNGLFCLFDFRNVILYNPAIREFKVIYEGLIGSCCPNGHKFIITSAGLGFDPQTNDYKVVRFDYYFEDPMDDNGLTFCQVYDLSTESWRPIDHDIDIPNRVSGGELLKGRCHWIARREQNHRIISFDFSTEEFQEIGFPHIDLDVRRFNRLAVFDESLVLLAYTDPQRQPPAEKCVDIWVMQQYGVAKSWTKKFTVGPMTQLWSPIMLWKKETILLVSDDGQLVSCAIGNVTTDFDIRAMFHRLKVRAYRESLVSVW